MLPSDFRTHDYVAFIGMVLEPYFIILSAKALCHGLYKLRKDVREEVS
jgi:hypothetical protein